MSSGNAEPYERFRLESKSDDKQSNGQSTIKPKRTPGVLEVGCLNYGRICCVEEFLFARRAVGCFLY